VRTFGDVVYLMPPLVIGAEDLDELLSAVRDVLGGR
jgi:adenosylmethionine-8-amino-7-oxononanoate aminotransferase